MRLNKNDKELIEIATKVARDNLEEKEFCVGCAVRAKSGKVYIGVNIQTSHSICAEQVAIGQALACGERKFDTLVAVRCNQDGREQIVSPCGLCRYTMNKLNMDVNVFVNDENDVIKVKAKELLPYPYKR